MVGAITNGMGNPTEIPILSEFFHFCVSAEEEPGGEVVMTSLHTYASKLFFSETIYFDTYFKKYI